MVKAYFCHFLTKSGLFLYHCQSLDYEQSTVHWFTLSNCTLEWKPPVWLVPKTTNQAIPFRGQPHPSLVFNPLSSLFFLLILLISLHSHYSVFLSIPAISLSLSPSFFICLFWAMPMPGDHFSGWYIDHHWLHPGRLHHVGLRWLLLHWRKPQHRRPAWITSQQQLHGLP